MFQLTARMGSERNVSVGFGSKTAIRLCGVFLPFYKEYRTNRNKI